MGWRERIIAAGAALCVGALIVNDFMPDPLEGRVASDGIDPICAARSEVVAMMLSDLQPVAAFNHQGATLELWQGANPAGPFEIVWNESKDSDHARSCVVILGFDWPRLGFVY